MSNHTVTLLKNPGCGPCIATNSSFEKKLIGTGLAIIARDMSVDDDAHALATETLGYMRAPVIVVHDADGTIVDHWSGLNPAKIATWADELIAESTNAPALLAAA
jgi:hypothetical protein